MVVAGMCFVPRRAVKAQPVQQRHEAIEDQNHLLRTANRQDLPVRASERSTGAAAAEETASPAAELDAFSGM